MMRKTLLLLSLAALTLSFSFYPLYSDTQVVGPWKWVMMKDLSQNKIISVEKATFGMAKEIKAIFNADYTYDEIKVDGQDTVRSGGKWKLEADNTVLSLLEDGRPDEWISANIVTLTTDSLVLELVPEVHLVMVREK